MADNPFEDPDVQAAAHSDGNAPPPVPNNVYGGDNAYDEADNNQVNVAMVQAAAKYIPPEQQKQLAVSAGSAMANQAANKVQQDYEESNRTQSDQHEAPPPPSFCIKFFFWFRLLSRMWGRAWFYLFVSILCYAPIGTDSGAIFTVVAGVYITFISIASFLFSRMAGKKFGRMREFIAAGAEGDELEGRFMRKFDELDLGGKPGTIGSVEIVKLAEQAGRTISNSERHAVQTFLDESCNGFVSKEDWMKMFVTQYEEKGFKQKFL